MHQIHMQRLSALKARMTNPPITMTSSFHVLSCFDLSTPCANIFSLQRISSHIFFTTSNQLFCLHRSDKQMELLEIPLVEGREGRRQGGNTGDGADMEIVSFGVTLEGSHVNGFHLADRIGGSGKARGTLHRSNSLSGSQSMLHAMMVASNDAQTGASPQHSPNIGPVSPQPQPSDDIILSVAFVNPYHPNTTRHSEATLNFYKVNLSQLKGSTNQSQRDMAVTLLGQQQQDSLTGGIPRSFSTPILNQGGMSPLLPSPGPHPAARLSPQISLAESTPTDSTTSSPYHSKHHYPSSGSDTSFGRSFSHTNLSSLFDIKRFKKQIPFNSRGSWSLHSIPMCHYPHHATLTKTINGRRVTEKKRIVLISATEKQMHCFIQDDRSIFLHVDVMDVFPEISTTNLLSSIITMDIYEENDRYRVIAIGGQNGWIRLTVYDLHEMSLVSTSQIFLNGPISSLKFFKELYSESSEEFQELPFISHVNQEIRSTERMKHQPLNLVVGESVGRSIIYRNVLSDALKSEEVLGEYDDSVSCLEIADLFGTGYSNIIVGTYSKKLHIYTLHEGRYIVNHVEHFESPVYAIKAVDIVRDGVREIVVLTMYQVCILQIDLRHMENVLKNRLSKYRIIKQLTEEVRQSREELRTLEVAYERVVSTRQDGEQPGHSQGGT